MRAIRPLGKEYLHLLALFAGELLDLGEPDNDVRSGLHPQMAQVAKVGWPVGGGIVLLIHQHGDAVAGFAWLIGEYQ